MKAPYGKASLASATLPIALLSAIVRKEALLPEHTAAFAAAQLLPFIEEAVRRQPMRAAGQQDSLNLRKELLVSANNSVSPVLPQARFSC